VDATQEGVLIAQRYELGALLRRGGMADVHGGLDTRLQRPVAIKLLRPEMAARADVRQRFEAEARAAASLAHPNVVAVYDTGEHDGVPYIVMERLPGRTLADVIAEGPVDVGWLLPVAAGVLSALGAAHAGGIVHRDVKPANVLLSEDGSAKISDFGIAKSAELATGGAGLDLTATGQLVGTPAYVAPERLVGAPATFLSDLYSMGVVLYEALSGEKPCTGATFVDVARAVASGVHQPLGERRPDLDPAVAAAVEKALAPDPTERFASAEAMAEALVGPSATVSLPSTALAGVAPVAPTEETAAMATATQVAPGPPLPLQTLPPRRRRPPLVAVLAAGAVALIALLLLLTGSGSDSPQPVRSSPTSTALPPTTAPPTTVAVRPVAPTVKATAPQREQRKGHKDRH
jgi:serine/threonine protein kinase